MTEKPEYFTIVFDGRLRDLKQNPFKVESPFGKVVAVGVGDALGRQDTVIELLEAVTKARTVVDAMIGDGLVQIETNDGSIENVPDFSAELSCAINRANGA
jgi:hypothetical protein